MISGIALAAPNTPIYSTEACFPAQKKSDSDNK